MRRAAAPRICCQGALIKMSVVIYNSQDPNYKTPFGAVRAGEFVSFTLMVPVEYECKTPYLVINRDGEAPALLPMKLLQRSREGVDIFTFSCPNRFTNFCCSSASA